MSISLENRALLSLIAKTSFGKDVAFLRENEKPEDVNWADVYKESVQQTVLLFASGAVSDYKDVIPNEVFGKWLLHSSKVISNNMAVMKCQRELTDFLVDNGYKYVILKGLASSYYYENPDMRMLGDVDFLIDSEKTDEISKAICDKLGYNIYGTESHICHITMTRKRDAIEMHFEIPGIPHGENGEFVRKFVKNILDGTNTLSVDGQSFEAPSHLLHGTVILLHMIHHMSSEGLGLRHLCDWGAFVNKTCDMPFWESDFLPFLQHLGLVKYVSIMSSVCQRYMGIDMPKCLPVADSDVCEEMINDILQSGNFGNKDEQYHQSGWIVSENGKDGVKKSTFSVLLGRLDSAVKLNWPWFKKHKILLPLAYVAFTVRYYFKVITGKRPSLTSLMPEANRRKELYKKLEIYEAQEVDNNIKKVSLSEIYDVIQTKLDLGGTVELSVTGTSMLPLLVAGKDKVVISPPLKININDIIFYRRNDGHFVLHRVVDIDSRGYVLCGDNQWQKEYGITDENVIGVVTEIIKNGTSIEVTDKKYLKYCQRWLKTLKFRKPLISVMSKIRAIKRKMSSGN